MEENTLQACTYLFDIDEAFEVEKKKLQTLQQKKIDLNFEKRKSFFLNSAPEKQCVFCGHRLKSENEKYLIPLMHLLYMP